MDLIGAWLLGVITVFACIVVLHASARAVRPLLDNRRERQDARRRNR